MTKEEAEQKCRDLTTTLSKKIARQKTHPFADFFILHFAALEIPQTTDYDIVVSLTSDIGNDCRWYNDFINQYDILGG